MCKAVHLIMATDFLKEMLVEGRPWRNLMDALPAECAALAMSSSPVGDGGTAAVRSANAWLVSLITFAAE